MPSNKKQDKTSLPVKRSVLSDRIIDTVSEAIRRGDYKPGDRLVQDDLAAQLNVSRTPLRDALNDLKRQGLVEEMPRGFRVVKPSLRDLMDMLELLAALDGLAAKLAARRAGKEAHEVIMRAAKKGALRPPHANPKLDFHYQVVRAAETPHLLRIRPTVVAITELSHFDVADVAAAAADLARKQHIAIAEAIKEGDEEAAMAHTAEHWLSGRDRLREQLEG